MHTKWLVWCDNHHNDCQFQAEPDARFALTALCIAKVHMQLVIMMRSRMSATE